MKNPNFFVAVPLPGAVKGQLKEKCDQMRMKYAYRKWVDGRDYHITLKFLGNCTSESLSLVKRQLSEAVKSAVPFTLFLQGVSHFGRSDAPRILWAGVKGELESLGRLQVAVEQAMAEVGFQPENRPYRPHVTLARQYQGEAVPFGEQAEAWGADWRSGEWTARSIVLYKTLFGQTPMYVPVQEFRFHSDRLSYDER